MVGVVTLSLIFSASFAAVLLAFKLVAWRNAVSSAWLQLVELERNKYRVIPVLEKVLEPYPDFQLKDHHCMQELKASLEKLCPDYVNPGLINDIEANSERFIEEFVEAVGQFPEIARTEHFDRIYNEFLRKQNTRNSAITRLFLKIDQYNQLLASYPGKVASRFIKTGWTFCSGSSDSVTAK